MQLYKTNEQECTTHHKVTTREGISIFVLAQNVRRYIMVFRVTFYFTSAIKTIFCRGGGVAKNGQDCTSKIKFSPSNHNIPTQILTKYLFRFPSQRWKLYESIEIIDYFIKHIFPFFYSIIFQHLFIINL